MRCYCCNRNLSDYESTLRHPETLEYLDTCTKCLKDIPITPLESGRVDDDVGYDDIAFDDEPLYVEEEDEE